MINVSERITDDNLSEAKANVTKLEQTTKDAERLKRELKEQIKAIDSRIREARAPKLLPGDQR